MQEFFKTQVKAKEKLKEQRREVKITQQYEAWREKNESLLGMKKSLDLGYT